MKATGEVMSVGRNFEESLLKAARSLEIGAYHLFLKKCGSDDDGRASGLYQGRATDDRIFMP